MWHRRYCCDHLYKIQSAKVPQQLLLSSQSLSLNVNKLGLGQVPREFGGLLLCGFLLSGALRLQFQPLSSPKFQSLLPLLKKTSTFYLSSVFLYHGLKIDPRLKARVNAKLISHVYF